MNEIKQKIVDEFLEIFEDDNLDLETKIIDHDAWDSLSVLALLAFLDSEFKIHINKHEIEDLGSFNNLCAFILKNEK